MRFVHVVLIFTSLVSAEPPETLDIDEFLDANINGHVDRIIPQISQFIVNHGLDPLDLPQTEKKLWMKLPNAATSQQAEPMIYKADLVLHSGILKRLSDLKRYGDATMSHMDKVLKLNVGFEFKLLQGTYDFTVKLVFFNLNGRIVASAASVRANIGVTFNATSTSLSLDKFELQVPGSVKVIVENKSGGVDWLNTFIANVAAPFFKDTITNAVQKEAASAIQTYFDEINRSISGIKVLENLVFENHVKSLNQYSRTKIEC